MNNKVYTSAMKVAKKNGQKSSTILPISLEKKAEESHIKESTKNFRTILYRVHEAAALFPDMTEVEYNDLKEDIRNHGQQVPITVQNEFILDGRQRYRACIELGVTPKFQEFQMNGKPVQQIILSLNLHRRHLAQSQRALIAARLANLDIGGNQHTAQAVTQAQAASDLDVSVDSLQRAKTVLNLGAHELIEAVADGIIDVSNAAAIATLPEMDQQKLLLSSEKEVLAMAKAIRKEKTAERRSQILAAIEAKRSNNVPLNPNAGPYGVILADPPWDYLAEVNVGYPTMSIEEICAMPVSKIAAEDAVLFMWCSASLMKEALAVIDAWGFTYKTQAIWDKKSPGHGMYFRGQHEVLMLATRGKLPEVPVNARPSSVMSFSRREHSRKPDYAYDLIEGMYPELNKIELFCRGEAKNSGWAVWGNESISADQVTAIGTPESQHAANNSIFENFTCVELLDDRQAA